MPLDTLEALAEPLELSVDDQSGVSTFDRFDDGLQCLFDTRLSVAHRNNAKARALPTVLMVDLSDRNIHFPESILDATQDGALLLERARARDVKLEREHPDHRHSSWGVGARDAVDEGSRR